MTGDAAVELAAAVRAVRAQLREAAAEGERQDVQFEVGPVELEFDVQVVRSHGAEAKVYVLSGRLDRTSTVTHRLKLSLTPQDAGGRSVLVNGTLPRIPEF